jgi:hypothetical protein
MLAQLIANNFVPAEVFYPSTHVPAIEVGTWWRTASFPTSLDLRFCSHWASYWRELE